MYMFHLVFVFLNEKHAHNRSSVQADYYMYVYF